MHIYSLYFSLKMTRRVYILFLLFTMCSTDVNAQNMDQVLVAFRTVTQGESVVLKSDSATLFNTLEQQSFPYGFVLPDAYCHREQSWY